MEIKLWSNPNFQYETKIGRRGNSERVSKPITYNFERFFFNVYGQWNSRSYKYGHEGDGRVRDWFINTSIGYRF